MGPPRSTERLKSQILRGAVEDNLDAIHSRLPQPLRPWRRLLRLWSLRAWRVAFPVTVIVALAVVTRWPAAAPLEPPRPPALAAAPRVAPIAQLAPRGAPDVLLPSQPISSAVLALTVRRVVIDAGHGGENLGASSAGGLVEKELTLDIARRVHQLMGTRGFETVMTRSTDETLSLEQRASTANGHRGDIFVSIHLNSLKPSMPCGIETYYLGPSSSPELDRVAAAENQHSGYSLSDLRSLLEKLYMDARRDESRRLASSVQRALLRTMRKAEPALTDRGVKRAPFVVLLATEMPAILAEVSCLSNAGEAERLKTAEYRQTIAGALVSGIQTFSSE